MKKITIAGLGFASDSMTLAALKAARTSDIRILRTARCGAKDLFESEGLDFISLDELYEQADDFEELNKLCAEKVIEYSRETSVFYGVFDLRDASVKEIVSSGAITDCIPGAPEEGSLYAYLDDRIMLFNASDWESFLPDAYFSILLREVVSPYLASECKVKLMDCYSEEHTIYASVHGQIRSLPLCEMDRLPADAYDHTLSFGIPAINNVLSLERFGLHQFYDIVKTLRSPGGCPWDSEQTHASISRDLLEEAYEAVDAIEKDDLAAMIEELGDVLLQVIFHSSIADDYGEFTLNDVITEISQKMIRRHPHVFGTVSNKKTNEELLAQWDSIKKEEHDHQSITDTMKAVADALPALTRARKIAARPAKAGFSGLTDACLKASGLNMQNSPMLTSNTDEAQNAIGDYLFGLCALCAKHGLDPEAALQKATNRFVSKFDTFEKAILADGDVSALNNADIVTSRWRNLNNN